MTKEQYAWEWLQHAQDDLAAGRFLLAMMPLPANIVCFHCQQAAEKALKAFLAFHGTSVPRTHDLVILNESCAAHERQIETLVQQCMALNDYAVDIRYPSELHVEDNEAQKAIKEADGILSFIRGRIHDEQ